jgi:hypothetical protein
MSILCFCPCVTHYPAIDSVMSQERLLLAISLVELNALVTEFHALAKIVHIIY